MSIMAEEDVYKLLLEDDDELNDLDIDPELEEQLLSTEDDEQHANRPSSASRSTNHSVDRYSDGRRSRDRSERRDEERSSRSDRDNKVQDFDSNSDEEEPTRKRSRFSLEKKQQHNHQQQQPRNYQQRHNQQHNQRRDVSFLQNFFKFINLYILF